MKANKKSEMYLFYVREYIRRIEDSLMKINKRDFLKDLELQDAILRRIEIIGEAVKNLPKSITRKYPEIPWQDIAGMRDKLAHDYFEINLDLAWIVAKKEIKSLKKVIEQIIGDLDKRK